MLTAVIRGVGVPRNGPNGRNWPISGLKAGITVFHLLLTAKMVALIALFSMAC